MAGQVNQFLGTHAVTYVYAGTEQANAAFTSGSASTNGLWLAQSFNTGSGQTAVGWVTLYLSVTGSPAPVTVSLEASSGGAPSGTALASTQVPAQFPTGSVGAVAVMLPATGLASSAEYWLVAQADGDGSDFFSWGKSAAGTGAATSTGGVTWTGQSYGLAYAVFDQAPNLPLAGTWEDSGARWTAYGYNGSGQVTSVREYTTGQAADGYAVASRAVTYSGLLLTKVA
jgi:hypothetical protein